MELPCLLHMCRLQCKVRSSENATLVPVRCRHVALRATLRSHPNPLQPPDLFRRPDVCRNNITSPLKVRTALKIQILLQEHPSTAKEVAAAVDGQATPLLLSVGLCFLGAKTNLLDAEPRLGRG